MEEEIVALPSAILAEKSVVSCCLQHERLYREAVGSGIDSACFHFPGTRLLFELCSAAERNEDGAVDLVWLVHHLQDKGKLERAGGASEVCDIYNYAHASFGWSRWLEMLREMKARRMAIEASRGLSEAEDSGDAIQRMREALEALQTAVSGKSRAKGSSEAINEFIDQFKKDREAGDLPGKPTGIEMLDRICGGMRDGQLWVVAGPTSSGKSVLMYQIAAEFIKRGEKVAIFSLEMMANEIIGRFITVFGRIDHGQLNQPKNITKGDLHKMKRGIEVLQAGKYWIDDGGGQSIDSITAECERIKDMEGDVGLVVVDYLQLIEGSKGGKETREQEVARASKGLKQLAKTMRCPVLTGSQLNDDGKTRESRAIANDADALLYICDDGLKIGKLRNGKRDDVLPLFLDGPMQVFQPPTQ